MVEFLLFCLATVGMTSIIVQGVIFLPFRQFISYWAEMVRTKREEKEHIIGRLRFRTLIEWFDGLINCAQCTGFWCGLFCGLFFLSSDYVFTIAWFDDIEFYNRLLMWFCCGLAGSFLSSFGCNAVDWMFYRKMNALRQLEEQDFILADLHAQREHQHEHDHLEHGHQEHEHDH